MGEHSAIGVAIWKYTVTLYVLAVICTLIWAMKIIAIKLFRLFFESLTQPAELAEFSQPQPAQSAQLQSAKQTLAVAQTEPEVRRRRSPLAKRAYETNPAFDLWSRRDCDDEVHE